eukprot:346219-Alexandrium_andersonii.AAC.1
MSALELFGLSCSDLLQVPSCFLGSCVVSLRWLSGLKLDSLLCLGSFVMASRTRHEWEDDDEPPPPPVPAASSGGHEWEEQADDVEGGW